MGYALGAPLISVVHRKAVNTEYVNPFSLKIVSQDFQCIIDRHIRFHSGIHHFNTVHDNFLAFGPLLCSDFHFLNIEFRNIIRNFQAGGFILPFPRNQLALYAVFSAGHGIFMSPLQIFLLIQPLISAKTTGKILSL